MTCGQKKLISVAFEFKHSPKQEKDKESFIKLELHLWSLGFSHAEKMQLELLQRARLRNSQRQKAGATGLTMQGTQGWGQMLKMNKPFDVTNDCPLKMYVDI